MSSPGREAVPVGTVGFLVEPVAYAVVGGLFVGEAITVDPNRLRPGSCPPHAGR
jgi:hypothetical protein